MEAGNIKGSIQAEIARIHTDTEILDNLVEMGVIQDKVGVKLYDKDNLKRSLYYQTKRNVNQAKNGHIGSLPPLYGGPPSSANCLNQWNRLDPSEILVHNVKCQDEIDDFLESQMRR